MTNNRCAISLLALAATLAASAADAADIIVVGVDAKFAAEGGAPSESASATDDSVVAIDASKRPLAVKKTAAGLNHSIMGPPQTIAATRDGRFAFVSAPTAYDAEAKRESLETFLTVVDLSGARPAAKVDIGAQPAGLALSRDGKLLLAACVDGSLKVLGVDDGALVLKQSIPVGKRLFGVAISHDGRTALAGAAGEGVAVLAVDRGAVALTPERIAVGSTPYDIDVSEGRWAAVTNLGGLPGPDGEIARDVGVLSILDMSQRPIKIAGQFTTPATPEGVAISPDGRWIVVHAADGSNLPADNPRRKPHGKLLLYENRDGETAFVNDLPGGEAGQGAAFARDNATVFAEFNLEKQIAIFRIKDGKLTDSGERIAMPGSPVSIATAPR